MARLPRLIGDGRALLGIDIGNFRVVRHGFLGAEGFKLGAKAHDYLLLFLGQLVEYEL